MRSVFLFLIIGLFLNYIPEDSDEDSYPQHYSWDLGVPDNTVYTEVIYDESTAYDEHEEPYPYHRKSSF